MRQFFHRYQSRYDQSGSHDYSQRQKISSARLCGWIYPGERCGVWLRLLAEIVNFDALVRHGMIAAKDLELIQFVDDLQIALQIPQRCMDWRGRYRVSGHRALRS
jgi:hypothetical protein